VSEPARPTPPPPLEANDQLVTGSITAGWAVALIVLLIVRGSLPADARWWIWTCVTGLAMGLFGLWYVPRLKRGRSRAAARRAAAEPAPSDQPLPSNQQAHSDQQVQSAPRDSGSNTVSSTDTPGKSTMS
jgi:ABC-type nickel/cobalt efflux system permease component RcnA